MLPIPSHHIITGVATPRTPASNSPRYKSLPGRLKFKEDEIQRATILPKSKTTFSNDITPSRILAQVRASQIDKIFKLAKDASVFTEANPLIPSLKRHIFRIKDETEIRKLAYFFSQYLKVCEMGEILAFSGDIQSIVEKCHTKMEHVPFETRLKIRYKEFYAREFIRLFKNSVERNLVIYEKFCLGYQWFTEFQFIAHALKKDICSIGSINHIYIIKFLIHLAVYSDINNTTFLKYFSPVLDEILKSNHTDDQEALCSIKRIIELNPIEDIRMKKISDNDLLILELKPSKPQLSLCTTWEAALRDAPSQLIKEKRPIVLNWSHILKEVKEKGSSSEMAEKVAHDLRTHSITYFKEVTLANFCHLKRGSNWVAKLEKHWNASSIFARRTIEDSAKKGKGKPNKAVAEFMIEIAFHCFNMHDLQTASALIMGINGCKKLPKLSKDADKKLNMLTEKFDLHYQSENLRREITELEKNDIGYVAYLPLISKEIVMVDNGNPDIKGRQINEDKLKFITRTFEKFLTLQSKFVNKEIVYTDILFELRDRD